jgi:tetratricopeptide (TPR) repeat protein
MTKIILLLLIASLTACGGTPAPRLPQALEQVQAADKDARRALKGGELSRAQHGFAKTLLLQQALDDTAGAATTMINLATVAHQLHDDEGALVWLDKILLEKTLVYPADAMMAASFRKAVILTNLARLPEAELAFQQADKRCEKKCQLHSGIAGLHARLLLLQGDAQGALILAQALSKEADAPKEEQANALRVVAAAEEQLTRLPEALQHYQSALEMDKALGLGARIGEDLLALARVAKKLGREQEASAYSRRAALVDESLHQTAAP